MLPRQLTRRMKGHDRYIQIQFSRKEASVQQLTRIELMEAAKVLGKWSLPPFRLWQLWPLNHREVTWSHFHHGNWRGSPNSQMKLAMKLSGSGFLGSYRSYSKPPSLGEIVSLTKSTWGLNGVADLHFQHVMDSTRRRATQTLKVCQGEAFSAAVEQKSVDSKSQHSYVFVFALAT